VNNDPLLSGATIRTCPFCFFEKLENGHWKWHCDNEHPEIMVWMEKRKIKTKETEEAEEEAFWSRRD
jgi:hypothetical protein